MNKNFDDYENYIYLGVCKTGTQTIQNIFDKNFKKNKINHHWCYWIDEKKKKIIHKIYYFNPIVKEYLDKIKNKFYILIIRNPIDRLKSCYNFCKENKWFNSDFNEYINYYKDQNKEINIYNECKKLDRKTVLLIEHSRSQFELFEVLNININDIKFILTTENINKDLNLFLFNIFNIKNENNIHYNKSKKFIKNNDTNNYLDEINILLKDEIYIYNLLLEKYKKIKE